MLPPEEGARGAVPPLFSSFFQEESEAGKTLEHAYV